MRSGHRESPPCADTHRSVIAFPFTLESVPSAASSKPPATSPAESVEEPRFADHDVTTNLPCERPGLELEQLEARTTAFEEEEEVHREEEEIPALQHCLLPSSPQTPDRHPMIALDAARAERVAALQRRGLVQDGEADGASDIVEKHALVSNLEHAHLRVHGRRAPRLVWLRRDLRRDHG